LADPRSPIINRDGLGVWLQQVAWGTSKSVGNTSSYDLTGWGATGGIEYRLGGLGSIGLTAAYLSGKDGRDNNELISTEYEGGVYWRGGFGPVHAFARATAGRVKFDGTRNFTTTLDGVPVTRATDGEWKGTLYSAVAGVSYEARMGKFSLRPSATFEHFKLREKGYQEEGGGTAFDLTVGKRSSSETAVLGLLTLGYNLLGTDPVGSAAWMRVELEGGWRQILSGSLGDTTARFTGGDPFTLSADERDSGWRGGLRLLGGGSGMSVIGEVNAEQQQGKVGFGARLGVQFAL
uniref:autotransporter outer membrane beta-barrel domain-containing protein n=1 Tax=Sphingomonas sp. TaxID=28214 RepID=UPI00286DD50F